MSAYRTLTRLAAVCAINNFLEAPYPTLAGANIFDSKIEPVEDMKLDRAFPCCVIYTDYDKDHWSKGDATQLPRTLSLTVELLVIMTTGVKQNDGESTYTIDCPVTDSEIETSLDAFESQIFQALSAGNTASDAFNYLCPKYDNVISRRGASVEGGNRLAARQITLEMSALREPHTGQVPNVIEEFLVSLEAFDDYKGRVPNLRNLLTYRANLNESDRQRHTFGWPTSVSERLGYSNGGGVLTSPITFVANGSNP